MMDQVLAALKMADKSADELKDSQDELKEAKQLLKEAVEILSVIPFEQDEDGEVSILMKEIDEFLKEK